MTFLRLAAMGLMAISMVSGPQSILNDRLPSGVGAAVAQQGPPANPQDIQWFKKEMGIASKYKEANKGIYGMSWAHFLIMAFLVLFFFAAIGVGYYRSRKTREILVSMLEKEGEGK
jgi:hypothetical protein